MKGYLKPSKIKFKFRIPREQVIAHGYRPRTNVNSVRRKMVVEPEIDTIDDDLYSGSVIKYFKKDQKEEKKRER